MATLFTLTRTHWSKQPMTDVIPVGEVAEYMLGKGWFKSKDIMYKFNTTNIKANQLLQQIRTTKKYKTVEKKQGNLVLTKLNEIMPDKSSIKTEYLKERELWRLALFGFKLKEQV